MFSGCAPYCSWRLVALSLTILILLLTSVIVYFGAVKYPQVAQAQVLTNLKPQPQPLPPLPNSVIDSHGLRDVACPPVNTQVHKKLTHSNDQQFDNFHLDHAFNNIYGGDIEDV